MEQDGTFMTPRWPGALLGEAALFLGRNLLALILLSGRKTCCCVREAIWCVLVCQLSGKGLTRQACCERVLGTVLATDCEASPLSAGQTGMLLAAHSQLLSGLTCVVSHLQACKCLLMGQALLLSAWPLVYAAKTGHGPSLCPHHWNCG